MPKQKKFAVLGNVSNTSLQFYYLLAAGGIEFLFMVGSENAHYYLDTYSIIPCMLFLGTVFTQKMTKPAKHQLWLCLLVAAWFVIAQTQHTTVSLESRPAGLFFSAYLMAFPFAALTQDGVQQKGLKMIAKVYLAASMMLVAYMLLLMLDCLPRSLGTFVFWDGARLNVMWHPNVCASIFMIGIALCLGFLFQTKRRWVKCLLLAAFVLQFIASSLTNSRTAILATCGLIGGIVFFYIYKGGWKRFCGGLIAALVVIIVLFFTASSLYQLHNDILIAKYTAIVNAAKEQPTEAEAEETELPAEEKTQSAAAKVEDLPIRVNKTTGEVKLQGSSNQGTITGDLWTLNGRTTTWRSALEVLMDNPSIAVWGTDEPGDAISDYNPFRVAHAHNSWVEVLLGLGIPGLLAALIFTWIAVRNAFSILWKKNDMWKKSIAILVLCLLAVGFMEPYLFYGDLHNPFFDFIFFLCIGYMTQWREQKSEDIAAGNTQM